MKVVFSTSIPFIRQHEIDMYIDSISKNFDVEKWDLSAIYDRDNDKVSDLVLDRICFKSIDEVENALKCLSEDGEIIFVTNILIGRLNKIYGLLKKYNAIIVNINKEGLAAWLSYKAEKSDNKVVSLNKRIVSYVKNNALIRSVYKRLCFGNAKYDYLLSSYNFFPEDNYNFIKIHNIKYDEYLDALDSSNIISGHYILFIDAALAGHPMFDNSKRMLDRQKYLDGLNRLFNEYERIYKIPVVISAHPKSNYNESDFRGRKIVKYKTPILIQHCDYILSHYSTSLVNALLLKKPIQVITSKDLEESDTRPSVLMGLELAKMVQLNVINLDNPVVKKFEERNDLYDKFLAKYILNEKKLDKNNSELIADFLHEITRGKRENEDSCNSSDET